MIQKVKISEIKDLLNSGKKIKIKTLNNEYAEITNYIDKGILDTYKVTLVNGFNTNVSLKHKFFTDCGWISTEKLLPNEHKILCDDARFYIVKSIENIGKHRIVDITVNHKDHCFFGNGMLHHNSGKSLLASHALAETQKIGGLPIYIDTESAINVDFLQAIGVDVSKEKFLYVQLETVEEIFQSIEDIVTKIRASNKNRPVTIVVDSVAAASTKAEIEGDYDKDGWSTGKAIIISKAMRKITNLIAKQRVLLIFTNQLRDKLGVSFGDNSTTSGGKAIGFHSSGRLRASQVGKIKGEVNGVEQVIGIKTNVKIIKNRMGPPHRSVEFDIYFDRGIDNDTGWLDILKKYNKIATAGAYFTWTDIETGELVKMTQKTFKKVTTERPDIKKQMYDAICNCLIMKYKKKTNDANNSDEDSEEQYESNVHVDTNDVDTE